MISNTQPTGGLYRFEPSMEGNQPYLSSSYNIATAQGLQEQRNLKVQLGISNFSRSLSEGKPDPGSTERPFNNQHWKGVPSNEAITRGVKDASQTIIDLTGSDSTELGRPDKPIVIDLEEPPRPMSKMDPSREYDSVVEGLATLRQMLGPAASNQTHHDSKSTAGEPVAALQFTSGTKSGTLAERPSTEHRNPPDALDMRDTESTSRAGLAHGKTSTLPINRILQSKQNESQTVPDNRQHRQGLKIPGPPRGYFTVLESPTANQIDLANPWRVSNRALSRHSSHGKSAVGAPSESPSPVNPSSVSGATKEAVEKEEPLRDSGCERNGPKSGAEERELENVLNGSLEPISNAEEDSHSLDQARNKKGRYGSKDAHPVKATVKTTTEISLDGIKTFIRDLVGEMAQDQVSRIKLLLTDAQKAAKKAQIKASSSLDNSSNDRTVTMASHLDDEYRTISPLTHFDPKQRADREADMPKLKFDLEVFESEKRVEKAELCFTSYSSQEAVVPRYKCYTAAKNDILSEDDDVLRYMPYFDEQEPENVNSLCAHFKDVVRELPLKYRRAEQARRFLPLVEKVLEKYGCSVDDAMHYIVQKSASVQASGQNTNNEVNIEALSINEDVNLEDPRRAKLIAGLDPREEQRIPIVQEVCRAFFELTSITMWEVLKRGPRVSKLIMHEKPGKVMSRQKSDVQNRDTHSDSLPLAPYTTLGCNVCFMHECLEHGGFDDGNVRQRFSGVPHQNVPIPSRSMQTVVNGQESGAHDPTQSDQERPCSGSCFLKGNPDRSMMSDWSEADLELLKSTLPAWSNCKTAACTYSAVLGKPCAEVYSELCKLSSSMPSESVKVTDNTSVTTQKKSTTIDWTETKTHRHEKRKLFIPCNHSGPCMPNFCICADEGVACERSCLCSGTCRRRYQGCSCGKKGRPCRTDKCECVNLNRECEPDLCSGCGAVEALDPVNRHEDNILGYTCGNVNLQRGIPKRTLLGRSEVEGYGLFMGEAVKGKQYLGEYVGELISAAEADRRGAIYDLQQLSYLFSINKDQEADATRIGNKFRFVNHSGTAPNCRPKVLLVNGVHRIAIFSTRDIKAGEELFFDYGPQYHTSLLSKEPKRKKLVARSTPLLRDEREESGRGQEPTIPPESKKQNLRRRKGTARTKRNRETDERSNRRLVRARAQDQESLPLMTRHSRKNEQTQEVTKKRGEANKEPPASTKPASKHQPKEQAVENEDVNGNVNSAASDTDDNRQEDQSECDNQSNHGPPDVIMKDAAAGDGDPSDKEYSEDDDDDEDDDEALIEQQTRRRGLRDRNAKMKEMLMGRLRRSRRF